jgi:hypothetical protein
MIPDKCLTTKWPKGAIRDQSTVHRIQIKNFTYIITISFFCQFLFVSCQKDAKNT